MSRLRFPAVLALSMALGGTTAVARSLELRNFQATVEIETDGVVRVEERIEIDFQGSWNGIFRDIPYGYTYPGGVRSKIRLVVDAVEDDAGNALEHWQERKRGQLLLKIRVPDAKDARRTLLLRYHAEDVIRSVDGSDAGYGMHDELYWNVTGNGWQVPIHQASIEVRLPAGVGADDIRATAYTGQAGAREGAYELESRGARAVFFRTTGRLAPYSGLTVVVGFPPGHVQHPSIFRRAGWLISANWFVGAPLALAGLWWLVWRRRGRDSIKDRTIVPEWEAPLGLRPSEIGVLIDDRMDQRDLTASIFDLAVRGVLTIHEPEAGAASSDYKLVLHEQALDGAELETFEEALIDGLFGGASEVRLGSLHRKFHEKATRVGRKVSEDLVVKGLFRARPEKVQQTWILLTVLAMGGLIAFGVVVGRTLPYFATLVLCLPPMFVLAWKMPQRTKLGLDVLARIKGMEEYLATAEQERLEKIPLHQIERLLPYAIALGLHERWSAAFSGLFQQSPLWYVNPHNDWSPHLYSIVVGEMNRSVAANLYSVPRTQSSGSSSWGGGYSGGSGFSGGGSSGGGFGGGGGGGW